MDTLSTPIAPARKSRWGLIAFIVASLVLLALLGWGVMTLIAGAKAPPARQVAKISLLPDTPPPPPPPKVEKPPEPREEPKPTPQVEPQKVAEAPRPANEPIKMEGAAGDGPGAFGAGTVSKEYSGGPPQLGAPQAAATGIDRAQERLYANGVRQQLRDAVERHLQSDTREATAEFALWLERDGRVRRFELLPSGNAQLDAELNQALAAATRELRLPPPPAHVVAGVGSAMKFRLSLRPLG